MLYLDRVSLHNFKSFRSATIRFSKGFNCIVGPNGSGKSNICDSLLFAFGENSLKRIRVTNSTQLINDAAKPNPEDGIKRAWVSIKMSGDKDLDIVRHVKSNNKVGYRLNGKHATRQEVIDVLRANRGGIEITNTITQGEIIRMLNLNAKERRELIDVAAGIREFDEKKEASMKELEKVEEKISGAKIMLDERMGFLNELEKEKTDAEKYLEMTSTLKRVNFTSLKLREQQLSDDLTKSSGLRDESKRKKNESEESIAKAESEISRLASEKEKRSAELNKRSIEINSTNHVIEELSKEIAVKEERGKSLENTILTNTEIQRKAKDEEAELKARTEANEKELTAFKKEMGPKLKELAESEVWSESEDGNADITTEYNGVRGEIEELSNEIEAAISELSRANAAAESLGEKLIVLNKEIETVSEDHSSIESEILKNRGGIESLSLEIKKKRLLLKELESSSSTSASKAGQLDLEILHSKESISMAGSSDKTLSLLKKSMGAGFYGRVKDLCEYDDKNANAIYAASQSRINYFVVGSIEDANKAIELLKANGAERASFIPLNEILTGSRAKIASLKPVIDLVKYDRKFSAAIEYVFSNTYLVESVLKAKEAGIGKARFVTLDGELIEPSGVVTGGTIRKQPSLSALTSKLHALQEERSALSNEIEKREREMDALRKEIAGYDVQLISKTSEVSRGKEESDKRVARLSSLKDEKAKRDEDMRRLREVVVSLKEKADALNTKKVGLKAEELRLYSIISGRLSESGSRKANKEKVERAKKLRGEIEQMKMATASKEKENEMMRGRILALSKEIASAADEIRAAREENAQLNLEIGGLSAKRKEMENAIKGHDSESASLYKQISQYDEKISKLSFEKGKFESELSKAKDKVQEYEMAIAQAQTRLGDIKAELMSYHDVQVLDISSLKTLEEKAAVLKNEIEVLGPVNLKAPEMYSERKKMVEEATQKLSTLENEKNSIIAIIDEVERKKLNIFNETLAKVNTNFSRLYSSVFEGTATLGLSDPSDPFNSGLIINLPAKGKTRANLESKSGGEKSLISLMLLFSIQLMNPMSFYIFDEIDSALDEENSIKLSKLTKELSKNSQFIVVSHNNALIQAADTAIGVMRQEGESRVVGLQIETQPITGINGQGGN